MTCPPARAQTHNQQPKPPLGYSHVADRRSRESVRDCPVHPHLHGFWWRSRHGCGPAPGRLGHRFFWCASGTGMRPYNRAVHNQVFHIRVVDKMLMHRFPNTVVTPTGKSFVDAVPITILLWQVPPLSACAANPENGFNKETTTFRFANIGARMSTEKSMDFAPLRI